MDSLNQIPAPSSPPPTPPVSIDNIQPNIPVVPTIPPVPQSTPNSPALPETQPIIQAPPPEPTTISNQQAVDVVVNIDPQKLLDENVFTILGMDALPDEEKKQIEDTMTETIHSRVIARIMDDLGDANLEAFKQVTETGDNNLINQFIKDKGIDVEKITLEEAAIYKADLKVMIERTKSDLKNNHQEPVTPDAATS